MVTGAIAQGLTREQALKIGSDNEGVGNGKFWFEHGDASPPFAHAGHIKISSGTISLTLNDGATSGLGVDAPFDDGSQTRLDFFTSANGKGWAVAHVLKPEIGETRPKSPQDQRPQAHKALSPAAQMAIGDGDLNFLKTLLRKGLVINEPLDFESGDTLLHEATSYGRLEIAKLLLQAGADPAIRNRYGKRPIDTAINSKQEELCVLMAKPGAEEEVIDGVPSGLISEVIPQQAGNEAIFVSWNGADPSQALLAEIRKCAPNARPASRMETLDRRPLGAHSWYQDKVTKDFGTWIEVSLKNEGEIWKATVRTTVGPSLAGGGWNAKACKKYGYWHTYDFEAWTE